MNYTKVKNPQWANQNHTIIDCNVLFDDFNNEYLPFSANPSDISNPSSKQIFDECFKGIWGIIAEYELPVQPAPAIPTQVSMRQARLALLQVNLLAQVESAIANGTQADQITWEYATEVNRSDALVQNLSAALGLSETDLDNLFNLASTL